MNKATKIFSITFGSIMASAGLEHGIGEILQGDVAPGGIWILSWPESAFFKIVGGEPAMTIFPNMLISGILTTLIVAFLLVWVLFFTHKKHSGLIMALISLLLLLAGGGIFPPVLALITAAVCSKINSPMTWWQNHFSNRVLKTMSLLWPCFFGVFIFCWLAMLPGLEILNYFFGVNDPSLVLIILGAAFGFLVLVLITGFSRDALKNRISSI